MILHLLAPEAKKLLTVDDAGFPKLGGRPLKLPPKERAVLAMLALRRPNAVSKHEFAGAAWAGQIMSDESLARCVSQLRRVLSPHGLRIESVYGTGYRLESPPDASPQDLAPPAPLSGAAPDAYTHARQLAQQRSPAAVGRAIELLRGLITSDPGFVPAKVALAEVLTVAVGWGQLPTEPSVEEGLRVLDQARLQQPLAPGLDAAHGALLNAAWRFDEAASAFGLALRRDALNPDTLLAHSRHLLHTNQAQAAVKQLQAALRLSPHVPQLRMTLSRALAQAGQGDLAMAEADAAVIDHPGQLVLVAFALSMRAMVAPRKQIEAPARRLSDGADTPPFVWTVLSYVLSRLGQREDALEIIDIVLRCSRTTTGEATLYAAPLAALGEFDRAAQLLEQAYVERCGMLAMVLRDPAHAHWLPHHAVGRQLLRGVFGEA